MRESIKELLLALSASIEQLELEYPKLKLSERVDVGAQLGASIRASEKLHEKLKADLKAKWEGKPLLGTTFVAEVGTHQTTRFDTTTFKEERPKLYVAYCVTATQTKLTFKIR